MSGRVHKRLKAKLKAKSGTSGHVFPALAVGQLVRVTASMDQVEQSLRIAQVETSLRKIKPACDPSLIKRQRTLPPVPTLISADAKDTKQQQSPPTQATATATDATAESPSTPKVNTTKDRQWKGRLLRSIFADIRARIDYDDADATEDYDDDSPEVVRFGPSVAPDTTCRGLGHAAEMTDALSQYLSGSVDGLAAEIRLHCPSAFYVVRRYMRILRETLAPHIHSMLAEQDEGDSKLPVFDHPKWVEYLKNHGGLVAGNDYESKDCVVNFCHIPVHQPTEDYVDLVPVAHRYYEERAALAVHLGRLYTLLRIQNVMLIRLRTSTGNRCFSGVHYLAYRHEMFALTYMTDLLMVNTRSYNATVQSFRGACSKLLTEPRRGNPARMEDDVPAATPKSTTV